MMDAAKHAARIAWSAIKIHVKITLAKDTQDTRACHPPAMSAAEIGLTVKVKP